MTAEQATEVRGIFLYQQMFFEACGRETGDKATYDEVWNSWARRNFNDGVVADRVLTHHRVAFQPDRLRGVNAMVVKQALGYAGNAVAYCALSGLAVGKGTLDIRNTRPDLFEMLVRSDRVLRAGGK